MDPSTIETMFQKLITCLSSNSKKVMMALISHDDPVSAQHLADSLGLSISQVRYSIKKIQACLIFNGMDIQLKPNEGIQINLSDAMRRELLDLIQNNNQDITILKSGRKGTAPAADHPGITYEFDPIGNQGDHRNFLHQFLSRH